MVGLGRPGIGEHEGLFLEPEINLPSSVIRQNGKRSQWERCGANAGRKICRNLGPHWYPAVLIVLALPQSWVVRNSFFTEWAYAHSRVAKMRGFERNRLVASVVRDHSELGKFAGDER